MFERKTDCDECQALRDGQDLFRVVEELAIKHDLDAERVGRAIRELHSLWYALTINAFPELQIDPETVAADARDSLWHRMDNKQGHTH
ncbi:hypothetical protein [Lentisalinibacter sediminis]|uniref:hypothetical protein n=1 Tax=Lentisalinibacter sediminis TaxID=2992237 RepID=UPI003868C871